jgi:hypothetical protein
VRNDVTSLQCARGQHFRIFSIKFCKTNEPRLVTVAPSTNILYGARGLPPFEMTGSTKIIVISYEFGWRKTFLKATTLQFKLFSLVSSLCPN